MGTDTPISALSDKPKLLFTYFKQNFAQVTNPPIDPIREELVMSLSRSSGRGRTCSTSKARRSSKRLEVRQPILTNEDLEKIRSITEVGDDQFKSHHARHHLAGRAAAPPAWQGALDALCERAEEAVRDGINIIILSDRKAGADRMPMPSLLGCAAVHHHLIRKGLRTSVGLVVEIRRAARSASLRLPRRLRRRGDQSLSRLRDAVAMQDRAAAEDRREGNRQALHQGDRQGPAQGDVQDGHLDLPVLLRRADFRRGRPEDRLRRHATSPAPPPASRASASTEIAEEAVRRHRDAFGDAPIYATCSTSAANMPCACAARTTSGPPTTVATLQHAVRGNSQDNTALREDLNEQDDGWSPSAACSASRPRRKTAASRCRSTRSSRPRTSSSASRPARCRSARSRAKRTPRSPSP